MSSSTSSISTPSTNASSERVYDFEYMMKLAASSASALSSTSTLAQLNSQEDLSEIVKLDPSSLTTQNGQDDTEEHYNYSYDVDDEEYYDSEAEEEEEEEEYEPYGSWYDIRTDLSDEQLDELKSAVYDAISLTLPLSPVSEPVSLPLLPLGPAPRTSLEALVQQQQQQYSAPIVRHSNYNSAPPTQFQSRAFATLATKRQTQTGVNRTNTNLGRNANVFNGHNASNAFNWRRDGPRNPLLRDSSRTQTQTQILTQTRPKANVNANTVSSWRKTKPGTEWKYNEESNGYKLIKV